MGVTLQVVQGETNTLVLTNSTDHLDVIAQSNPNVLIVKDDTTPISIGVVTGASAYEVARINGFSGTEGQWLASLKGPKGDDGSASDLTNYYTKPETNTLLSGKQAAGNYSVVGHTHTKSEIGLGNVDNTSDANKPVSTAQATALSGKENSIVAGTTSQYYRGDKSWQTLNKTAVGLANVDNTTDANKPVSAAQQLALDNKANLASPTFTGTVGGITKSMVGLGNVDNTSDVNKPVSVAQQTALNAKADLVGGFVPTSQIPSYAVSDVFTASSQAAMLALNAQRGDFCIRTDNTLTYVLSTDSPSTLADWKLIAASGGGSGAVSSVNSYTGAVVLGKADIGLDNVDNTSDAAKPISTATASALSLKAPLDSPAFTGTPTGISKGHVGLSNVNNTSDTAKPVSTAQQTALNLKANLASPTFTGTVGGITAAMVGLGSVNNTADVDKPISTLTQNALDAKANATAVVSSIAHVNDDTTITPRTGALTLGLTDIVTTAGSLADTLQDIVDEIPTDAASINAVPSSDAANFARISKPVGTTHKINWVTDNFSIFVGPISDNPVSIMNTNDIWIQLPSSGLTSLRSVTKASTPASATSLVLTVPSGVTIPVNSLVAVAVGHSGTDVTGITDSKTNTWTTQYSGQNTAAPATSCRFYTTRVTTELVAGDTFTIAKTTSGTMAAVIGYVPSVNATPVAGSVVSNNTSVTATITLPTLTDVVGELQIAAFGLNGGSAALEATGSGWTLLDTIFSTSGSNNKAAALCYRQVTSAGTGPAASVTSQASTIVNVGAAARFVPA